SLLTIRLLYVILFFLSLTTPSAFYTLSLHDALPIFFRYGGTTGGVDIIARIVHQYIGWSMGKTMFLFDFIVITTSVFAILDLIEDRKSTRLNSSHVSISYAVFCLKKKKKNPRKSTDI